MEGYASGVNAYCGRTLFLRASRAPCARAEHAAVMCLSFNKKHETRVGGEARNHNTQSEMFGRLWPNLGNF